MEQTLNVEQASNKPIILISCSIEGNEAADKIKLHSKDDFEFIIETQTIPNQAPPSHESFFETNKIEAVVNIYSDHWRESANDNYINFCNKNNSLKTIFFVILKEEDKEVAMRKFKIIKEPFNLSISKHLDLLKQSLGKLQRKSVFIKRIINKYVEGNIEALQAQRLKKFWESLIYSLFGAIFIVTYAVRVFYYDDLSVQKNINNLNWYIVSFHGIKLAAVLTVLGIMVRHCFITARMLNIERIKLYDKEHAINYGRMFIDIFDSKLVDEDISKQDIHNAFKNWNIERSVEKFIKAEVEDDKLTAFLQSVVNFFHGIKTDKSG